ncbi:MAG: pyridoxal-phosphate dependent enzyme [Gammaproteobacteria bacterium]
MLESLPANPALDSIKDPLLEQHGVSLDVLRLDAIHPRINGNKWFKLKLNLQAARKSGHHTLLSFGGAYSNHLRALAAAASQFGFRSIGVVRGEAPEPLNPVLAFAREQGMILCPVSRAEYRLKEHAGFIESLHERFGEFYLIPEGGSNAEGVAGCESIVDLLSPHLQASIPGTDSGRNLVALACGTGATLAGLIRGVQRSGLAADLLGVAVLKGAGFLTDSVTAWLDNGIRYPDWQIAQEYHFGGYARQDARLLAFITEFADRTGIPLEPVYTGKLLFALYDLVARGVIPAGSRVICLHTGGTYPGEA